MNPVISLARNTWYAAVGMSIRLFASIAWLWCVVQVLPAADLGWLASLLAVCAVCALLAQAGIPYLFFADQHSSGSASRRWNEALGVMLVLGPIIAMAGGLVFAGLAPYSLSVNSILAFTLIEVISSALVQAVALQGHAAGRLGFATGLPALIVVARACAALTVFWWSPITDVLEIYLVLHTVSAILVLAIVMFAPVRALGLPLVPVKPSAETVSKAWRYAAMGGSAFAMGELDKPVMARTLGLTTTGHYALAYRICSAAATPATAFSASLIPKLAGMWGQNEHTALLRTFAAAWFTVAAFGITVAFLLRLMFAALEPGALGLYPEVWSWMTVMVWLVPLIGLHQLAAAGLLAVGLPLWRSMIDLAAFMLFAGGVVLLTPVWGARVVPFACILTGAAGVVSATLVFVTEVRARELRGKYA